MLSAMLQAASSQPSHAHASSLVAKHRPLATIAHSHPAVDAQASSFVPRAQASPAPFPPVGSVCAAATGLFAAEDCFGPPQPVALRRNADTKSIRKNAELPPIMDDPYNAMCAR